MFSTSETGETTPRSFRLPLGSTFVYPVGVPLFFFDSASIEYAHVLIALYSFLAVKKKNKTNKKRKGWEEEVEEKGETVSREERILSIRSRGAISM